MVDASELPRELRTELRAAGAVREPKELFGRFLGCVLVGFLYGFDRFLKGFIKFLYVLLMFFVWQLLIGFGGVRFFLCLGV